MAPEKGEEVYARINGDFLEVRQKLGPGKPSSTGKTTILFTTGGNIVVQGQHNGKPVFLGVNCYTK